MANTEVNRPLLSVVIPVFREGAQLSSFLAAVRSSLSQCRDAVVEVGIAGVGEGEVAEVDVHDTVHAEGPGELIGELDGPVGVGGLVPQDFVGGEHARGDAVIVMDADGQHPPSLIPEMVRMWQSSASDIVEAVKRRRGRESLSSKLGALLFYFILNKLSGFHFKGASDFKLMNRKAVNAWLEMHERNVFFRGMTVWMGFNTVQIPFEVVPRSAGQSTWSVLNRVKLALVGITAFSSFPLHLVTLAGMIFLGLSVLLGVETLYLKLTGRAVSGFATVILLELMIGSFLMISLGIIGEYLARIYEEVKGRPRYIVAESIKRGTESARS